MVGQTNYQTPMVRLAQDQRHVCVTFQGTYTINVVTFAHVNNLLKKPISEDMNVP
jgi:hypothetical protein